MCLNGSCKVRFNVSVRISNIWKHAIRVNALSAYFNYDKMIFANSHFDPQSLLCNMSEPVEFKMQLMRKSKTILSMQLEPGLLLLVASKVTLHPFCYPLGYQSPALPLKSIYPKTSLPAPVSTV